METVPLFMQLGNAETCSVEILSPTSGPNILVVVGADSIFTAASPPSEPEPCLFPSKFLHKQGTYLKMLVHNNGANILGGIVS